MSPSPGSSALSHFLEAQERVYDRALKELRSGRKKSHWMWFVFPQLAGLGSSSMATRYAISSQQEARAYLDHPVLGERLIECTNAALSVNDRTANEIFGDPDDLKFCSSMTLFETVGQEDAPFGKAIESYYDGRRDDRTLELLRR